MDRLANALKWAKENLRPKDPLTPEAREKVRIRMNYYINKRKARDPGFRLMLALRSRLGAARRSFGFRKCKSTLRLLGCTTLELKRHLESLWQSGMCWENYGEWHIDHKRPCASFDLLDPAQQCACFHFTNLQPLWSADNYRKSDKWREENASSY